MVFISSGNHTHVEAVDGISLQDLLNFAKSERLFHYRSALNEIHANQPEAHVVRIRTTPWRTGQDQVGNDTIR